MKFTRAEIPEIVICEPEIWGDSRGYFMESFRQDKLEQFLGFPVYFCQDNQSKSAFGVLRGLHYQAFPMAQSKLIRVLQGRIWDVAVDIRIGSPTFGDHVALELSEENQRQLFIPKGFAHGFVTLSHEVVMAYKVDNYYSHEHDRGIAFQDELLSIDWKIDKKYLVLSDKDKNQPVLDKAELFEYQMKLYA